MINKNDLLPFEKVFPQASKFKPKTKEETIALAKTVAAALKRERAQLVKEQQENNFTSGFFSTSF